MSGYVYMKVLESAPGRYDRGIRMLSHGAIDLVYGLIAERVADPGKRVLDIGCGTGGVTLACAARGASVVGIDINAGMLEVARSKLEPTLAERVELLELGAMEIEDRFPEESFDAVVSCLAFSELSPDEQSYVLTVARSRLKPGGALIVADETLPRTTLGRLWKRVRRLPSVSLTYLLTQTTTRPVDGLVKRIREAGFARLVEERFPRTDVLVVEAWKALP
jgi:ubiquinone/menaquinone biosynthesis C-methylase UbiE